MSKSKALSKASIISIFEICFSSRFISLLVSLSDNFLTARKNIIKNIDVLNWNEGFYRKDIGHKVIKS